MNHQRLFLLLWMADHSAAAAAKNQKQQLHVMSNKASFQMNTTIITLVKAFIVSFKGPFSRPIGTKAFFRGHLWVEGRPRTKPFLGVRLFLVGNVVAAGETFRCRRHPRSPAAVIKVRCSAAASPS